ncbi:hypothetical protein WJX72_009226 [[Myrmecia] bisecta]|uniref:Uncharacterized protein n=1 Tax=[Myrmecia] bisecta TaxID=41462 RepID=A0AAW1PQN8_9CHLO
MPAALPDLQRTSLPTPEPTQPGANGHAAHVNELSDDSTAGRPRTPLRSSSDIAQVTRELRTRTGASASAQTSPNGMPRSPGHPILSAEEPASLADAVARSPAKHAGVMRQISASALKDDWKSREQDGARAARSFVPPAPIDESPPQTWAEYLQSELNPGPSYPTADVVFGQTERDRVYNAIIFVPYQLERLLWFGLLLCFDSFLAIFTLLPIRFCKALYSLLQRRRRGDTSVRLQGDQLFDILCVLIYTATVFFLRFLNAGAIYFWMKDLTQEFLKLHVIYTAVEIFDKIFCSFGVDTLEALSGTCTQYLSGSQHRGRLRHLVGDTLVALTVVMLHGAVIMCQGMAFSVAMNSKRNNALVALLIAANFIEIKGTVFKRYDPTKLFQLTCQDVVERFHLLLTLMFVLAEEMDNSGNWYPNRDLLWQCGHIFAAEVVIDVIKHAVVGKFNQIRPGVYREFMNDLCEKVKDSQSHNVHKAVQFEPFAPAALFLRIVLTCVALKGESLSFTWSQGLLRLALCLLGWVALCALRTLLGFSLKRMAFLYVQYYEAWYTKGGRAGGHRAVRNVGGRGSAASSKLE